MGTQNGFIRKYDQYSPLLYKLNYMLYAALLGAFTMYEYVVSQGGTMPPPGSFHAFCTQTWKWLAGPIIAPILIAGINYWRGRTQMKRRSSDK